MADLIAYVVRQGDFMTKLAHTRGFDAKEVWNDPKNDAIRGRRPNMDILAPGDVVYLPKAPKSGLDFTKEATNRYKAKVPMVDVDVTFTDSAGDPIANEAFELQGLERGPKGSDPPKDERTTDGDGKASFRVPVTVREVVAHFPRRNVSYAFRIGDMDPIDESTGAQKRLTNLGYLPADLSAEALAMYLPSAIRTFQKDEGVEITGSLDAATLEALSKAQKQ